MKSAERWDEKTTAWNPAGNGSADLASLQQEMAARECGECSHMFLIAAQKVKTERIHNAKNERDCWCWLAGRSTPVKSSSNTLLHS